MADDKVNEEDKFDFTSEGEGYISLDEARVLAMRTAVETPGNYGSAYQGVDMFFEVVEATETDDFYYVTLSFRPQGNFDGTPGQEQFVVGKEGAISVRQVHSLPTQTSASPADTASNGGAFPLLPVAIGVVVVGIIAAVGAIFLMSSSGGDSVPVAAVAPTETPAPTTSTFTPMLTYTPNPTHTPPPSLSQYHEGRILLLNVLDMKPTDELRYSTFDPTGLVRKWRINPVAAGNELLLMRIKVENHIAVNAVVEIDEQAAVLSDYFDNDYRPISITNSVIRDQRGQEDATVTFLGGLCVDHPRTLVNAGSTVQWINGGDIESAIQFDPGVLPEFAVELIKIAPGASISHRFDQPGTFDYQCSSGEGTAQKAQILVETADSVRVTKENNILFLDGLFELGMGTSIDGWMVFEVPKNTRIRDLHWRTGDSITIRF